MTAARFAIATIVVWIVAACGLTAVYASAQVGPGGFCTGVKVQKMMRSYNRTHRGKSYMTVSGSIYQIKLRLQIWRMDDGHLLQQKSIPNFCQK
jgi:hypothetical protein